MTLASDIWQKAFCPPDRRWIEDWAAENISLPPVLTKRGSFSIEGSKQFVAPLRALRSDRVRGVRICAPVRGGKTLIADIAVPWAIANDNASVLWVFQDAKIGEEHAEQRQMPILKSVPVIKPLLPMNRHQQRKSDILFANGLPLTLQGPALGGLQSKGFKWVVLDEPWLYKPGVIGNAKARMGDFEKIAANKFLAISQGGDDDSEWDFEFRAGVLFVFNVPCLGCGKMFAPEWTMRRTDGSIAGAVYNPVKYPDGTYNKDASAKTVRFVCPHCGHEHENSARTRQAWNRGGDYFNPDTGERFDYSNPPSEVSFRWHGLLDYPWEILVKYWLAAQEAKHVGNFKPIVEFFQKRCALMRSERTIHDSDLPFARQKIELTAKTEKLWDGEAMRFLTADRQSEDTYWVTARAWGANAESRRLWFGKLFSEADIEAKRIEYGIAPDCTVVDSGYKPKGDHGVYAACIRYGWIAAKGTDEPFFWHAVRSENGEVDRVQRAWAPLTWGDPGEGTSSEGQTRCPLIRFSAPTMADRVMGLIERGLWIEPDVDDVDEMEREYRRQMTAEFKRPKVDKFTGRRVMVYVCPSGNNHAFDDSKMQVLCAMQAGLIPAGLELLKPQTAEKAETE